MVYFCLLCIFKLHFFLKGVDVVEEGVDFEGDSSYGDHHKSEKDAKCKDNENR